MEKRKSAQRKLDLTQRSQAGAEDAESIRQYMEREAPQH
jgi:hypothetical protein